MKIDIAGVAAEDEAHELTADIAILVQLSALRDAQARLARERGALLAAIGLRPPVEGAFDETRADLDPPGADLSPRLESLATEQAAADESAHRLAASLSPDARRIYVSLSTAHRRPFIVPLKGDGYSGCNMRLPSGLLGDIRRLRRLHLCPSCKRVLSPSSLEA